MKIEYRDVEALKPYENNPRDNRRAVDLVAGSIDNYGFLQPVVISPDNVIIVGHTRLEAAKKLGLKQIPVVVADELTEEQKRAGTADCFGSLNQTTAYHYMLKKNSFAQMMAKFAKEKKALCRDVFGLSKK